MRERETMKSTTRKESPSIDHGGEQPRLSEAALSTGNTIARTTMAYPRWQEETYESGLAFSILPPGS